MSAAKATAGVSAKQRAANQANAEESTGPRTTAGKTRSAKNATTHGIYARPTPVPGGEFAEDADAIDAFTQEIVDSLAPRNGLERMAATRVATALLHAARLDRYSALQIARCSRLGLLDTFEALSSDAALLDDETAAGRLITDGLERISVLDARVGRELERALTIYSRVQDLTIADGDEA